MLSCFAFGWMLLLGAVTPAPAVSQPHVFTATMARRIDDLGRREVATKRAPGLSIGIVEDGRIVYAQGFGFANRAKRIRVGADTQFYVGGITEQFTAAAVLLLQQDGKLKLDDKIGAYLPELTTARDATIGQLLQHTAGLPEYPSTAQGGIDLTHATKMSDVIAAIDAIKPIAAPGTRSAYTPLDYALATAIVERASGIPLSDYLQQHIFLPLVMNETFLAGDRGISPQHAIGYTGGPAHFAPAKLWDPTWLGGANGLVSNVYDLAKWDIGLPLLLRVDAERTMFTPTTASGMSHYGLGWVIDERAGKRYIWQNGEIPGYLSMNALLPDDNLAVIVLENTDRASGRAVASPEAIAANVIDIVLPPTTVRVDNVVLERAREWLDRLAAKQIDRTQLTPAFSQYLTDALVTNADFASLGKPIAIIPIASTNEKNGDTSYEFLVRYAHNQYHYRFVLAPDTKIDGLYLTQ